MDALLDQLEQQAAESKSQLETEYVRLLLAGDAAEPDAGDVARLQKIMRDLDLTPEKVRADAAHVKEILSHVRIRRWRSAATDARRFHHLRYHTGKRRMLAEVTRLENEVKRLSRDQASAVSAVQRVEQSESRLRWFSSATPALLAACEAATAAEPIGSLPDELAMLDGIIPTADALALVPALETASDEHRSRYMSAEGKPARVLDVLLDEPPEMPAVIPQIALDLLDEIIERSRRSPASKVTDIARELLEETHEGRGSSSARAAANPADQ